MGMKVTTLVSEQGRVCTRCKKFRRWDEYFRHSSGYNGYTSQCKQCYCEQNTKGRRSRYKISKYGRECTVCRIFKPWHEFANNCKGTEGKMGYCRQCDKFKRALSRYGITKKQYNALLKEQNNRCAICGVVADQAKNETLCVDHDHQSGKVRGLLCNDCNAAIGFFHDSLDNLLAAATYLKGKKL